MTVQMVGRKMKSQLLVIAFIVLIITGISSLSINTNLVNASVICVDKYNQRNVISCSDKKAVDISTSDQQANGPTNMRASNMTSLGGSTNMTASNTTTSPTLLQIVKFLLEDSVQALKGNDSNKALERMNLADQQLSTVGNSTSIQEAKVSVDNAIQSLQQNQDVNTAIARLNLADQQLGTLIQPIPGNATKFLKYANSTYGIQMQYPSGWRVEGASNSPVVAMFFPQRNNASNATVDISISDLNTSLTPDQYLNNLMLGLANQPYIKFTAHTTSNVVLAGHPGFLLAGTFKRDPTSGVLEGFSNIGTIIGDKVYSIHYYSPEQTYPVYRTTYIQMIRSFQLIPTYICPPYIMCYSTLP
ncbi:MAG: hypothetical protein WAM14_02420 [Candidatus Nitrosopolaris sp.]